MTEKRIIFKDLQKMLESIYLRRIFNNDSIPEVEAYRIARAKSYASARNYFFV